VAGHDPYSKSELTGCEVEALKVDGAETVRRGHLQIWQVLGVKIPIGLGDVGVESDRVSSRDHGLFHGHVFKVSAGWPIAQQDAVAVHEGDGGKHEVGEIDQALVNLLVKTISLAAEDAVPVFHAESGANQPVVLGNGLVDNLVGF